MQRVAMPGSVAHHGTRPQRVRCLARAAVVVSGDTGVMHMATGVGTPVVALFGPTVEPFGFFPYTRRAAVLERDLGCRPCSAMGTRDGSGPSVDVDRFQSDEDEWPGHWAIPPRPWQKPERRLLSLEIRERLRDAIDELPDRQRTVVALRDVEGLSAEEVCGLLGLSAENQRVLLHRGRSRLRHSLEAYVDGP